MSGYKTYLLSHLDHSLHRHQIEESTFSSSGPNILSVNLIWQCNVTSGQINVPGHRQPGALLALSYLKVTGEIRPMRAYAVTLCRWNRPPSNSSSRTMS